MRLSALTLTTHPAAAGPFAPVGRCALGIDPMFAVAGAATQAKTWTNASHMVKAINARPLDRQGDSTG